MPIVIRYQDDGELKQRGEPFDGVVVVQDQAAADEYVRRLKNCPNKNRKNPRITHIWDEDRAVEWTP